MRFRGQLEIQREQKRLKDGHDLRVLDYLASRIQKKAFYCLKIYTQHSQYVRKMKKQQSACIKRRWFEIWREKYLNKGHYNYLCTIQRSLTKTRKRPSSVTFKEDGSDKRASSPPLLLLENVMPDSKSPSPLKRGYSQGGILRRE
jgi:hypothetical protein